MNFDWNEVWQKQTKKYTDLRKINGWSNTNISEVDVVDVIKNRLDLTLDDSMLEVGAGCGFLGILFQKEVNEYTGIDKSKNMVDLGNQILDCNFVCSEACDLPFEDNQFDYVVSYSIFQYFPSQEYTEKVILEMKRIARLGIYIGDLPIESHDENHLLHKKERFEDNWIIEDGAYTEKRFDVYRKFDTDDK